MERNWLLELERAIGSLVVQFASVKEIFGTPLAKASLHRHLHYIDEDLKTMRMAFDELLAGVKKEAMNPL